MVKDRDQCIHIYVKSSWYSPGEQALVVNLVERYSCGWTNPVVYLMSDYSLDMI